MKYNTLLILLLILMGCTPLKKEEKIIASYDTFVRHNQPIIMSDSAFSNESLAQNNFEKFQSITGVLSETDISTILEHELATLQNNPGSSTAESGPAMAVDTVLGKRSCASFDNAGEAVVKSFRQDQLSFGRVIPRSYVLRLAIHVVEDPAIGTVVTDDEIREQIIILNNAFKAINISFEIDVLNRKSQSEWYTANPVRSYRAFEKMTNELSTDPALYVNIFINGMRDWGYGTFPWLQVYQTKQDCVLIKDETLQGNTLDDGCTQSAMQGKTLIHEMGHFMGLFHTFHSDQTRADGTSLPCNHAAYDGCAPGDRISDTPSQKICHYYGCGECTNGSGCCSNCGAGVCDTCPLVSGNDPVNNFMGYNPDTCMDHFTELQYSRMEQWFYSKRMYAIKATVNLY